MIVVGGDNLIGDISVEVPAVTITNITDTVGAGDTFMGTILATRTAQNSLNRTSIATLDQAAQSTLLKRAAAFGVTAARDMLHDENSMVAWQEFEATVNYRYSPYVRYRPIMPLAS